VGKRYKIKKEEEEEENSTRSRAFALFFGSVEKKRIFLHHQEVPEYLQTNKRLTLASSSPTRAAKMRAREREREKQIKYEKRKGVSKKKAQWPDGGSKQNSNFTRKI
jgi:hypothetical protein